VRSCVLLATTNALLTISQPEASNFPTLNL
jgi:hypothetical protein